MEGAGLERMQWPTRAIHCANGPSYLPPVKTSRFGAAMVLIYGQPTVYACSPALLHRRLF